MNAENRLRLRDLIVLVGLLTLIVLIMVGVQSGIHSDTVDAQVRTTQTTMESSRKAMAEFELRTGRYPVSHEELIEAMRACEQRMGYSSNVIVKEGLVCDGWGRPIMVTVSSEGTSFEIRSIGANGRDDGGKVDDLVCDKSNFYSSGNLPRPPMQGLVLPAQVPRSSTHSRDPVLQPR